MMIELVIERGESLTKVSKKLNIKLSTAKLILRKYRKTGLLFDKRMNCKAKKGSNSDNKMKLNQ
jgi:transposase